MEYKILDKYCNWTTAICQTMALKYSQQRNLINGGILLNQNLAAFPTPFSQACKST
jgi:hypothetical protein